jgi:hypothetical protein
LPAKQSQNLLTSHSWTSASSEFASIHEFENANEKLSFLAQLTGIPVKVHEISNEENATNHMRLNASGKKLMDHLTLQTKYLPQEIIHCFLKIEGHC